MDIEPYTDTSPYPELEASLPPMRDSFCWRVGSYKGEIVLAIHEWYHPNHGDKATWFAVMAELLPSTTTPEEFLAHAQKMLLVLTFEVLQKLHDDFDLLQYEEDHA